MDKRLILAISLSLLVLLSWSALVSKQQPLENKGVIAKEAILTQPAVSAPVVAPSVLTQNPAI
ncbi:MAG: hypothetical protein NTW13_02955, partial [Candidatus Omnitrophica bacterium]|nr:hypothetical protein [Candidatus Omnitrophota bacterium]